MQIHSNNLLRSCLLLLLTVALQPVLRPVGAQDAGVAKVRAVYTLPSMPLAGVIRRAGLGEIADDRGVHFGGIGSDLWHGPTDAPERFWMITDRGPNGLVTIEGAPRRTFLVPQYTPLLLQMKVDGETLVLDTATPIVGRSRKPVSGVSCLAGASEEPWDAAGRARIPYEPSGIDPEGLVRLRNGTLWLSEEYGPSLLHVDASGMVLRRCVPEGFDLRGADYPVEPTLPGILRKRRDNRGFESLAVSADERRLFVAAQSPLLVPDKKVAETSRLVRLFAIDATSGKAVAEFAYVLEPAAQFDAKTPAVPADLKISGLVALADGTLLALERTDIVARVYAIDLSSATDLLGGKFDDPATSPSLESMADLEQAGVQPVKKRLVVDLTALPGVPGKIEGIALLDARTLAIVNDNDFGVQGVDAAGKVVDSGAPSRVWVVELPEALPFAAATGK